MFMFRYRMLLWLARRLGRIFSHLKRGWFPQVFWLLVTAFLIWFIDAIRHIMNPKADVWFQIWYILAIYAICWLLWWAWQASKRVVIDTFMDYRGAQPVTDSQGLATLLVVKLARLHQLYRAVDEQRAISTATNTNQPIDATIKVDDVSDFLTGAVSAQSKFSLGPIEIPVGTLLALFGRFVQGPRIIGSLHKDNDTLILTAQKMGGKPAYSWRVDSVSSAGGMHGASKSLDEMVEELACRIFTDLALSGTVRWRAAKAFSDGLLVYRECLRSGKDRLLNLRQAERKFIETLEEDEDFVLAHYNLGVVYMELGKVDGSMRTGQLEAAEETFFEAISHNPGSWLGYYALAVCRYQRGQYDSVVRICQRIGEPPITQKPGGTNIAKVFHMMGLAQVGPYCRNEQESSIRPDDLQIAIKYYKKALRLSCGALYRAELLQSGVTDTENLLIPQLEATLSTCMKDLAWAYTHLAEILQQDQPAKAEALYQEAHEWLRHATFLPSPDSENYFALFNTYTDNYVHLAKMYYARRMYNQSLKKYRSAIKITPDSPIFWSYLALTYAALYEQQQKQSPKEAEGNKKYVLEACEKVFENAFVLSEETWPLLKTMLETYEKLQEPARCQRFQSVAEYLQKVYKYQNEGVPSVEALDELVKEIDQIAHDDKEIQAWIYAQVALVIGKMYLDFKQQDRVEKYIREAIVRLKEKYSHVIREQELRVILVYSLLYQQKYEDALKEAERALVFDPLCYLEREALGDVFYKLNAFDNAIKAWQEALLRKNTFVPKLRELPKLEVPVLDFKLGTTYLFKQDDVDIHFKIGISYVELGRHHHDLEQKREAYRQAITYLERAEALYESNYDRQRQKHALYYFLGVLHFEQDEYQRAISYLRIAKTLSFARLTSLFYLGYAYLKNKEYDSCIKQFQALQDGALQLEYEGMPYDSIVEDETVGFMSLGELLAMAYWGSAFAYTERNANLEKAQELIQIAQQYMRRLRGLAPEIKVHWPAYCQDCEGWILFKLGEVDKAIEALKSAVTLSAHPQAYVHLALAYEWKLQNSGDEALLQQLRYCYQHVLALDVKNEYKQEMEVVSQRLQKI